jgi:hypothetical protein
MARTRRETWVKYVAAWRGSGGLTAKQFAARVGVNANTLAHWKWKLDAEASSTGEPAGFVEVTDTVAAVAQGGREPLEVLCRGGQVVRVPPDFDAATLVRLLDTLEGR